MRAHDRDPIVVCVQVRPVTGALRHPADGKESSSTPSWPGTTCMGPHRFAGRASRVRRGLAVTAFREVLHGEFDPGSGRTLAACLTHASGATNQGLPWGRAANG